MTGPGTDVTVARSLLVLADSDEGAVAGVGADFDTATVYFVDGRDGCDPPLADGRFDEIVIAVRLHNDVALRHALTTARERLGLDGRILLSLTEHTALDLDDMAAFRAAFLGLRLLHVATRSHVPHAVLAVRDDEVDDVGYQIEGAIRAIRTLDVPHSLPDGDDRAHRDLVNELAVSTFAADDLRERVEELRERLNRERTDARKIRKNYDTLRRSKLGRLTLRYWATRRRLRPGSATSSGPARRRLRNMVLFGSMLVAWAAGSAVVILTLGWEAAVWLVLMLVAAALVYQRRAQRKLIGEIKRSRQRQGRHSGTDQRLLDSVAAMRAQLAGAAHHLEALTGDVAALRDTGEAQVQATRTTRQAVHHSIHHLRQIPPRLTELGDTVRDDLAARDASNQEDLQRTRTLVTNEAKTLYRQVEALQNLYAMVPVEGQVPPMRGWAVSPDLMVYLVDLVRREHPSLIVECGSGVSTMWMALAARHYGVDTQVVALEHNARFASQSRDLLEQHDLTSLAEVRSAPLHDAALDGHGTPWYTRDALAGLDDIGLLFIDGPPQSTGPAARYPALPLLGDRLASHACVVLDDVVRDDEKALVADWLKLNPDFGHAKLPVEKGAALLTKRPE